MKIQKSTVNGPCDRCGALIRIADAYVEIRKRRICVPCVLTEDGRKNYATT